jgi:hypothetical protein
MASDSGLFRCTAREGGGRRRRGQAHLPARTRTRPHSNREGPRVTAARAPHPAPRPTHSHPITPVLTNLHDAAPGGVERLVRVDHFQDLGKT